MLPLPSPPSGVVINVWYHRSLFSAATGGILECLAVDKILRCFAGIHPGPVFTVFLVYALGALPPPLWAQSAARQDDHAGHLEFAAGAFDLNDKGNDAAIFQATYRTPWHFGGGDEGGWFHGFAPYAALAVNTDGGVFGHGGLNADLRLGRHWVILPSVGGGGYSHGQSKHLGGVFQFALGFAALYRLERSALLPAGSRVGIQFLHISNGGVHERNPGANSVFAVLSMPL